MHVGMEWPATSVIRVAVVDDHPVFRDGTAAVLGREPDIDVVAVGGSLDEARSIVAAADAPDVLILDVRLGEENGLTLLGGHGRHRRDRVQCLRLPAVPPRRFAGGRRRICRQERRDARADRGRAGRRSGRLVFERRVDAPPPVLTPREADVVRLVADGRTNEEVGLALGRDQQDGRGASRSHL